jgi:PAS domain S-box-containing protein
MKDFFPEIDQPFTSRGAEIRPEDTLGQYLQKLTCPTPDGVFQLFGVLSTDGILLEINRAALEGGALTRDEIIGKPFWETFWWTVTPKTQEDLRDAIMRAARGESIRYGVEVYARKNGKEIMVMDFTLLPVREESGPVVFLLLEGRDITELVRTKKALRGDEEQNAYLLASIVESSDDAIVSKNLDGIIMSWNRGAEHLFGYTAAEAVGQSIAILIPPDRLEEEPKILERLRRGERVEHFETLRVRKDGSLVNVSLTISPVRAADGRIVGASKVARDITEKVRQEAALQEANAALKRANADLHQFAYSASHDLQEPLRMVAIYSELLQKRFGGKLGPTGDEYIGYIVLGATRMGNLLRDLRAYAQVATLGKDPGDDIDAGEILKKVLLSLDLAISESGASISTTALPRVRMYAFQLEQVLQNLIGNAIRYRSDLPPRIGIAAGRQGEEWLFSVQDNGIGIDPQFKEEIFGIFKRLHTSAECSGTGMGLAICQRAIERSGGRIWVESEPGRGSTFYFTIPCGKPAREGSVPENVVDSSDRG